MPDTSFSPRRLLVFAVLALAFVLPGGVLAVIVILTPPPYVLVGTPDPSWKNSTQTLPGGGRARMREFANDADARAAVDKTLASIRTSYSSTAGSLSRYRARTENGSSEYGLIVAVDRYLVTASAPDEAALAQTVAAIPFIAPNPESGFVATLLDRHTKWLLLGILAYALALIVVASRLIAWAARWPAATGRPPMTEAALRKRLLALEFPGATVQQNARGELEFGYAAGSATEVMRVRLDAEHRVVRALSSGARGPTRGERHRGMLRMWWRTIPSGPNSDRIGHAVQSSGWTWQPVFTFVRVIGG